MSVKEIDIARPTPQPLGAPQGNANASEDVDRFEKLLDPAPFSAAPTASAAATKKPDQAALERRKPVSTRENGPQPIAGAPPRKPARSTDAESDRPTRAADADRPTETGATVDPTQSTKRSSDAPSKPGAQAIGDGAQDDNASAVGDNASPDQSAANQTAAPIIVPSPSAASPVQVATDDLTAPAAVSSVTGQPSTGAVALAASGSSAATPDEAVANPSSDQPSFADAAPSAPAKQGQPLEEKGASAPIAGATADAATPKTDTNASASKGGSTEALAQPKASSTTVLAQPIDGEGDQPPPAFEVTSQSTASTPRPVPATAAGSTPAPGEAGAVTSASASLGRTVAPPTVGKPALPVAGARRSSDALATEDEPSTTDESTQASVQPSQPIAGGGRLAAQALAVAVDALGDGEAEIQQAGPGTATQITPLSLQAPTTPASSHGATHTAGSSGTPAAQPPTPYAPLADQLSLGLARALNTNRGHVAFDLQPAELGKVSVKVEIHDDGRVVASLTADRPETLNLLRRDAHVLERGLQDAGYMTDGGSLNFNLRGEAQQRHDQGGSAPRHGLLPAETDPIVPIIQENQDQPVARASRLGGLDLRV